MRVQEGQAHAAPVLDLEPLSRLAGLIEEAHGKRHPFRSGDRDCRAVLVDPHQLAVPVGWEWAAAQPLAGLVHAEALELAERFGRFVLDPFLLLVTLLVAVL